jgi:hypothetical protein
MATLQSPGVSVSIINESFYTPAAPGTVPLIFVASASNKKNPSGATAIGTKAANAGKVYLVTSQRDLTDTFGTPLFYTDASGNPIHGCELNEYGLQAAYILLGVSSAAYIARAPIDLSQLASQSSTPAGAVADGSYWADTADSLYGIFEWNQTKGAFTNKTPLVIDDSNASVAYDGNNSAPKSSFGLIGQYCVVLNQVAASEVHIFYKNSNANWVEVGGRGETNFASDSLNNDFASTVWSTSFPTAVGTAKPTSVVVSTGTTFTLNGVTVGVADGDTINTIAQKINNKFHTVDGGGGIGAKNLNGALAIYVDAKLQSSVTIGGSTDILTALGFSAKAYTVPTVFVGPHTQYPDFSANASGSVYLKTTSPNAGAAWVVKQWSATAGAWNTVKSPVYSSVAAATYTFDKTGGGANIPVGSVFVESNYDHGNNATTSSPIIANYKLYRRAAVSPTTITGAAKELSTGLTSTSTFQIEATEPGSIGYLNTATITIGTGTNGLDKLALGINNAGIPNVSATINEVIADTSYSLTIKHATGGEIRFKDLNNILGTFGFIATGTGTTANFYELDATVEPSGANYKASNWKPLTFTASTTLPTTSPANGQLWYSSIVDQVDIMVHDGSKWKGYRNVFPATDPKGPIVGATKPTTQSDGVTALANGDIWISLAGGTEMYGQEIYVYDGNSLAWVQQDVTDQTSPNGILFADARWSGAGDDVNPDSTAKLLTYDYVDPDAPDPAEYPRGMRLFNLRRSGFNIKKYVKNHININANEGKNLRYNNQDMANYNPNRWVSVSPNNADGSGTFGRHAQRSFVVAAFKATIDGNQAIRDTDTLTFNLIATPGYPEAIQNMISLNVDRGLTAFVVGDTSMRLEPTGTALAAYGLNSNGAFDNGDKGLVSYNEYMAVFYPSGYTNDLAGNYIVVPPSHMMLRTIAVSDQKSYPWFAPAGIRRGVVDNATSVGYLKDGEFRSTALPQSIRDVMAQKGKINPIATITGAGIINFGQYTRANAASALDRINVARLVAYLRRQLDVLARPFLFEPNDKITRNEIKNSVQKLLLELVGQRALYDFIVVCDESNNTPSRIDRSELWVDVAIEPVKAVEFIYIPVRLVNTGAIKAGTYTLA